MQPRMKRKRAGRWHKVRRAIQYLEFPLIGTLRLPFWFRLALVGGVGLLLLGALMKPRIWLSTPRGVEPVIKASGLGMLQAWSLQRTANQAMAAGKPDDALPAWRLAISHNPGKILLVRGALEALAHPASRQTSPELADAYGRWLLILTRTNQADVELVVRVYERHHWTDAVLGLIEPLAKSLSPSLEGAYLKALFNSGQMLKFGQRWTQKGAVVATDPELRLYQAAYQAGWGLAGAAPGSMRQLETMQEDPHWRELANRLQMSVSMRTQDAARYQKALQRLWEWKLDTLTDHLAYWRLLVAVGREKEAVQLAQNFSVPPSTGNEAIWLADAYIQLHLPDKARQFLQGCLSQFVAEEGVWQTYARMLANELQWKTLSALALQMRQERPSQANLVGYSYYIEGCSECAQKRRTQAEALFRKLPEFKFDNLPIFAEVTTGLLKSGFPYLAKTLLAKTPPALTNNLAFWQAIFLAANEARQAELLLLAAQSAVRLRPQDWSARNNYAAALITLRLRPEEAITYTLPLLAEKPDSLGAKINHALALTQNKRTPEAEALLQTINASQVTEAERTALYLGWFEVYFNQHDYERARAMSDRIDTRFLFPSEFKWLEAARTRLTKRNPNPS
jgi:hypothetical protein